MPLAKTNSFFFILVFFFCRVALKLNPIQVLSIVRIQNFVAWTNSIVFTKPGYVTETLIARMVRTNPYKFVVQNRNADRINSFVIMEHVFPDIYNVPAKRNVLTDQMKKCAVSIKYLNLWITLLLCNYS